MKIDNKDLTVTINGVVYSAPVISRVEKILLLIKTITETNGGTGGDPTDASYLTPEQMDELIGLIDNSAQP